MGAAKGKKQVTLTVDAHDQLLDLAQEADRTLAGYIHWILRNHLNEIDANSEREKLPHPAPPEKSH